MNYPIIFMLEVPMQFVGFSYQSVVPAYVTGFAKREHNCDPLSENRPLGVLGVNCVIDIVRKPCSC